MESTPMTGLAMMKIATGLLMMAFFTLFWAANAYNGLSNTSYKWLLSIFAVFGLIFFYSAFRLIRAARNLPRPPSPDCDEIRKGDTRMRIIFVGEGIGIFIAILLVSYLNHPELIVPAMALVVGLHFIPLGMLFKRKFDYYLAAGSILIAFLAIVFSLNNTLNPSEVLAFTGIGMAVSTTVYGSKMMLAAREVLN